MDDDALVREFRNGERNAIETMVERHGERLFRSACLLVGQPADARDVVQETLLRAVKSAGRFEGRSSLYSWLHGILLNVARTHHRRSARWVVTDRELQPELDETDSRDATPVLDRASAALAGALRSLSRPHRETVILHYLEGNPIEEIARRMGVGTGTVKSRLHYARKRLRKILDRALNLDAEDDTHQ